MCLFLLEDSQWTDDHESDSHESEGESAKDTNGTSDISKVMCHEDVVNDQHVDAHTGGIQSMDTMAPMVRLAAIMSDGTC